MSLGCVEADSRTVGSSNGRGPRAAGWLQDVINEKGDKTMKSVAMEGGIKGWVNQGIEFTDMMEGYQAAFWENAGETC